MNTKKKSPTNPKKNSKNRLLCVTLPESLMVSAKAYQRKSGFSSMSELLRATVEHASSVALKKGDVEEKIQISFRLSDSLYTALYRAANQSGRSIARIIRTLLESAPKLGVRPAGMPEPKKRNVPAKKETPSAKAPAKPSPKKPVKKAAVSAKKPVAKKNVAATKKAPVKKGASAKVSVPAKKKPAKRK